MLRARSPIICTSLTGGLIGLFIYEALPNNTALLKAFMFVLGALIGGPYTMCISAIASDLGAQPALRGNPRARGTVAALLDGPASWVAAIGQIGVPLVADAIGWSAVFYVFMAMLLAAMLALGGIVVADVRMLCGRWRTGKGRESTDASITAEQER